MEITQEYCKKFLQEKTKNFSDFDLQKFYSLCKQNNLDPYLNHVYVIPRGKSLSLTTSIDGFRFIASQTGQYAGQDGPFWLKPDGTWVDYWIEKAPPKSSKVGVYRVGFVKPVWGVANWDEYNAGMGLWNKMPALMLAKCAEALALRKAFPDNLSSLYTEDEMQQADTDKQNFVAEPTDLQGWSSMQEMLDYLDNLKIECRETTDFLIKNDDGDSETAKMNVVDILERNNLFKPDGGYKDIIGKEDAERALAEIVGYRN